MKTLLYISLLMFFYINGISQETLSQKITCNAIDDKSEGYVLFSYKIPEEGYYTFSIEGGLVPQKQCVIYYYEYQLHLTTDNKDYLQDQLNIASQAQDGNICRFNTNEKNNKISGTFNKDERVQMRLVLLKSEVDGTPHNKLKLLKNTIVRVEKDASVVAQ